jgi:hypothetical protein
VFGATEIIPKFVSPSDPAARWTGAHGGQAFLRLLTNYLVDVENAIIVAKTRADFVVALIRVRDCTTESPVGFNR